MQQRFRWAARAAGLAVVAAAAIVPAAAAHAVTPPAVTVTPNTHLHGGDTVSVSGTGFEANKTAIIVECTSLAQSGCDSKNVVTAPTDGSGSFSGASYKLDTGAVGNSTCPSPSSGSCYLLVTTDPTGTNTTGVATVSFDPVVTVTPATGVSAPKGTVTVAGFAFLPNKSAFLVECANTGNACDTSTLSAPTTSATGSFSVQMNVHVGDLGGASCNPNGVCYIGATTDVTQNDSHQSTYGSFTFGPATIAKVATQTGLTAKRSGKTVKLSGVVKAAGTGTKGLHVVVYQRPKAGKPWVKVKGLVTVARGAYTITVKHQSHSEQYLVKHPVETNAAAYTSYNASQSKVATVA